MRSRVRYAGKKNLIEFFSQIDSKITACCRFLQPIGKWLVPNILAAGAKRKIALVRTFCENELCSANGSFIPPAFLFFYTDYCPLHSLLKKFSFKNFTFFYWSFKRYVSRDNSRHSRGSENGWGALWKREKEGSLSLRVFRRRVRKFDLYETRTII